MAAEYLMLAQVFNPKKHTIEGMYVSEKLDGSRAFWDGGVSRDDLLTNVPWANITDPKTGKPKKNLPERSTGLWSRYGNPIMAPDWFLNQLPCMLLDGELWAGRGNFQTLRSIVARDEPDDRWTGVHYVIFGCPSPAAVFGTRQIKGTQIKLEIDAAQIKKYIGSRVDSGVLADFEALQAGSTFDEELRKLQTGLPASETIYLHHQLRLPTRPETAQAVLGKVLTNVLDGGGEGVMLRDPGASWTPSRTHSLLKMKPFQDDEARIIGFTSGRETDKGSKHLGHIGALITEYNGKRLELSGMTDVEREFKDQCMTLYAVNHPGEDMPPHFHGKCFKMGDMVTFRYRELSDTGVPKEARYLRVRND